MSLVNRVTELQQHKWQLEERITHLESSSAAMADDLLKKSAIIQHFCMDHKNIGKLWNLEDCAVNSQAENSSLVCHHYIDKLMIIAIFFISL